MNKSKELTDSLLEKCLSLSRPLQWMYIEAVMDFTRDDWFQHIIGRKKLESKDAQRMWFLWTAREELQVELGLQVCEFISSSERASRFYDYLKSIGVQSICEDCPEVIIRFIDKIESRLGSEDFNPEECRNATEILGQIRENSNEWDIDDGLLSRCQSMHLKLSQSLINHKQNSSFTSPVKRRKESIPNLVGKADDGEDEKTLIGSCADAESEAMKSLQNLSVIKCVVGEESASVEVLPLDRLFLLSWGKKTPGFGPIHSAKEIKVSLCSPNGGKRYDIPVRAIRVTESLIEIEIDGITLQSCNASSDTWLEILPIR